MGTLSYPFTLVAGQPENVNQLNSNLAAVATVLNGSVDATNLASGAVDVAELATTLAAFLGVTQSGTVRRGKSIIATEEARTNVAYGTLTTPDQVSNVVLPTAGLLCVAFQGMWKESVNGAARAAVFLSANQLKYSGVSTAPAVVETANNANANIYESLGSYTLGLQGNGVATDYTGDVTTGQIVGAATVGGFMTIQAAAGTYDVSIQFKASSGSVTAKNRSLWVWTMGF